MNQNRVDEVPVKDNFEGKIDFQGFTPENLKPESK